MRQQTEQYLQCPYCGERISMLIDHSVAEQHYIEDCEVCCRPIELTSTIDSDGGVQVAVARSDD